jgi:hypothetical protein
LASSPFSISFCFSSSFTWSGVCLQISKRTVPVSRSLILNLIIMITITCNKKGKKEK